jgi:nucleotide-binding universal stress UspA family protein
MKRSPKPISKLLVATDLSRGSQQALTRAVRLPLASDAKVLLVHAMPKELPRSLRKETEGAVEAKLSEMKSAGLAVAKVAGNSGLTIEAKIARGEPHVEIIEAARMAGAEAIVMGRHGMKGIRSLLIGSTTMRVIRKGSISVLVVSRPAAEGYKFPMAAVALDEAARVVIETLLRLIDPVTRPVPVVHAYWPPFEGDVLARLSPDQLEKYHQDFQRKAEAGLKKVLASVSETTRLCEPIVLRGDPRSVVLEEAERHGSDVIAVGTHARSGLAHALLGSVAEWLISKSTCDVLVARP